MRAPRAPGFALRPRITRDPSFLARRRMLALTGPAALTGSSQARAHAVHAVPERGLPDFLSVFGDEPLKGFRVRKGRARARPRDNGRPFDETNESRKATRAT